MLDVKRCPNNLWTKKAKRATQAEKKQLVQKGTTVYYHEKTDAFRSCSHSGVDVRASEPGAGVSQQAERITYSSSPSPKGCAGSRLCASPIPAGNTFLSASVPRAH